MRNKQETMEHAAAMLDGITAMLANAARGQILLSGRELDGLVLLLQHITSTLEGGNRDD